MPHGEARGIKWIIRRPTYGTHAAGSHLRRNPRFITRRSEGQRVYSRASLLPLSLSRLYCHSSFLSQPRLLRRRAARVPDDCAIAFDTVVCPLSARLTIVGLIKRHSMLALCQEFLAFESPIRVFRGTVALR